jgi:putative transposase
MLVISLTDGRTNDYRERVVAVVEHLKRTTGTPARIAVDNGPVFISKALDAWAYQNEVRLAFSRSGKPTDNAFTESFNGHLRAGCLNCHWFASLEEARQTVEAWRIGHNTVRPHRALGQAARAAWIPSLGGSRLTFRVDQTRGQVNEAMG